MSVRLPRLLDGQMHEICRLRPSRLSLDESLTPPARATMTLPADACPVKTGSLMELYTPEGSAGIFRVQQLTRRSDALVTLQLEHSLVTLSDSLASAVPDMTGTAQAVLEALLSCQSTILWRPGAVEVPPDVTLTWKRSPSTVLSAVCGLMEQLPGYRLGFDQRTLPWTLHILALSDQDMCECRLSRNLCGMTVEEDRSGLCTRVYMDGLDTPMDADTISLYGVVSRSVSADGQLTAEELSARAAAYLEAHKHPEVSITLDALDLSEATGEPLDRLTLGRMCRVCLPEEGESMLQRIVRRVFPDVFGTPQRVTLTLSSDMDTAVTALSGLMADTAALRRQQQSQRTLLLSAQERISLMAEEIDLIARDVAIHAERIALKAAREDLDALGARLSQAEITLNGAEGQIGLAGRVSDAEGHISEALIDLNALQSQLTLKADRIDLQGYVTMQDFEAVAGWTESFTGHSVSADYITCGTGDFDNLTFGTLAGENCAWESKSVLTSRGNLLVNKRYLTLMKGDGTTVTLDVVTDVSLSASSSTTLKYLGQQ